MQNALRASIADLESQIAQTESQLAETRSKLKYVRPLYSISVCHQSDSLPSKSPIQYNIINKRKKKKRTRSPDAAATVRRHIRLLHVYNEIKDVGQGLMGLIAEARGVRQVDVETEFGVGAGD